MREQQAELERETAALETDVGRLREHLETLSEGEAGGGEEQLVQRILERDELLRGFEAKARALEADLTRREQALAQALAPLARQPGGPSRVHELGPRTLAGSAGPQQELEAVLRAQLERVIAEVWSTAAEQGGPIAAANVPASLLVARLRALYFVANPSQEQVVTLGDVTIDLRGQVVRAGGRRAHLTRREFELLRYLVPNRGRVLSRDELLERVWDDRHPGSHRSVDIHVHRLRQKLGKAFADRLETLRSIGYKLHFEPIGPQLQ